ncbi:ECF RNA polymerase sigma factor SigW [Phycisphaerae bacterium RAS1]|nr:ECF RNA polymerase sigma factor SigW [Phycisphaerae bacterium RAS1]
MPPTPTAIEQRMARSDEARLISRAKRGHADAFRDLVDLYKDRLFAFVWRTVRNHHEAEDICQSAFVKAYESLAAYNETYAFSTWLFTIAYRLSLNMLRKRRAVSSDIDLTEVGGEGDETAICLANSEEANRLRERIWAAVEQLSTAQRAAVLLFYREGKGCPEIGEILGMPAVTVKSHLHRAREKLRSLLDGELADDWMSVRFTDSRAG